MSFFHVEKRQISTWFPRLFLWFWTCFLFQISAAIFLRKRQKNKDLWRVTLTQHNGRWRQRHVFSVPLLTHISSSVCSGSSFYLLPCSWKWAASNFPFWLLLKRKVANEMELSTSKWTSWTWWCLLLLFAQVRLHFLTCQLRNCLCSHQEICRKQSLWKKVSHSRLNFIVWNFPPQLKVNPSKRRFVIQTRMITPSSVHFIVSSTSQGLISLSSDTARSADKVSYATKASPTSHLYCK